MSKSLDDSTEGKAAVTGEAMPVKKGQIIEEIANPEVMDPDYDTRSEAESAHGGERDHDVISAAGSEANGRNLAHLLRARLKALKLNI